MTVHLPGPDDGLVDNYLIRVGGHLGPITLAAFPALAARLEGPDTVLTGPLPDSPALYGVLAQLESLGLDLIELRRLRIT